jgi:very-short-patch-repair endonuclease
MFDDPALRTAATQHGAVARFQLRAEGLTSREIGQLSISRHWRAATSEVFVREGSTATTEQRLMVAVLDAGRGSHVSHLTAGRRWGLTGCALYPIHVVRVGSTRRTTSLARAHCVRRLPEQWVTHLEGLPIVRPELLALQLFAECSFGRAERLTDRLWSDRLLSGPSLQRILDDLGRSGRNGTAGLRRYLEHRPPDYVPPASGLESRFMELMQRAGIPVRRQVDSGGDRWTGRVDFRHRWLPLVIEIQSEKYHTSLSDRGADALRTAQLRTDGFVVLEISDGLVWTAPATVIDLVRRAVQATHDRLPRAL